MISALFMMGCAEEIVDPSSMLEDIRVTAGFADTKTTFVDEGDVIHVEWNKGDAIGLYTSGQQNLEYQAVSSGSTAEFTNVSKKLNASESGTVYAYYPYHSGSEDIHKIVLPGIIGQDYTLGSGMYDFVYAAGRPDGNEVSFQFEHVYAFLKIAVPLELLNLEKENSGIYLKSTEPLGTDGYFDLEKREIIYDDMHLSNVVGYYIPKSGVAAGIDELVCYVAVLPQSENVTIEIGNMIDGWPLDKIISKETPSGGFKAGNVYSVRLESENDALDDETQRKALVALYNSTAGENWINNDNWCTDAHISEWFGVTYEYGRVTEIDLISNNLVGPIPEEFYDLQGLTSIRLFDNFISGELSPSIERLTRLCNLEIHTNRFTGKIPDEICNLTELTYLVLMYNEFSGEIPEELGNMPNIWQVALSNNKLTGQIPESFGNLPGDGIIGITNNYLTGDVPESFMRLPQWQYQWPWYVAQCSEGFNRESLILRGPEVGCTTLTGESLSDKMYGENEFTILLNFADAETSVNYIPGLTAIYNGYRNKGLEILGYGSFDSEESLEAFVHTNKIQWPVLRTLTSGGMISNTYTPAVNIVDKNGNIVFDSHYTDLFYYTVKDHQALIYALLKEKLGEPEEGAPDMPDPDNPFKPYESSDYSADGTVEILQEATVGNGIDIILMGDAYSDRQIADGMYSKVMNKAAEFLFTKEPYRSYRDYFNVYMVNVVSKNEVYGGTTALEGYFGEGTHVGGNDEKCFEYALNAISSERMNEAMIVVMMNSARYAGTCWMYYSGDGMADYGSGVSVSYFPTGVDDEAFKQVLHHEANGHGFAKLDDEYAYSYMGGFPADAMESRLWFDSVGWNKNTDITNDPAKIKWAHFISDPRYANEGLGVYEGASTYRTGIWRPTYDSIMRYNTGDFNAPSREAIYYRIHKLAFGKDWEYDYEEFVEYDAINRNKAETRSGVPYRPAEPENFKPLAPPVVYNHSWREAMK